jgi:hypothetical protein
MSHDHVPFIAALRAVLATFWKTETDSDGGVISIVFGLIGAIWVMYSTRKPAFKARFVTLETAAPTLSGAGTK